MTSLFNESSTDIAPERAPSAEQVAAVVAGAPTIGQACAALRAQGWRSTIAGNRITVNDWVFVRFIDEAVGVDAGVGARWVVYEISERPKVLLLRARNRLDQ